MGRIAGCAFASLRVGKLDELMPKLLKGGYIRDYFGEYYGDH